ncbi:MAG: type II toxin-antitoxin system Phd/YefM family antitoxin [Clostridia bacterium]
MYNTNITNARNNLYQLINMALEDSEVVNVSTKNGNAVILSEADYNSLLETLYLSTDPQYKQSLIDGKNTSISDCVSESDVKW